MINIIKNDENSNKKSENINPEISEEIEEKSEKISKIVYFSDFQKEIWELQRLKRSLKENKDNFEIFDEKIKSQIRKIKTEIKKTKNTKKEILIIGQTHFTSNGTGNFFAGNSQKKIDIFLEYF